MKTLRLILWDQLSLDISALKDADKEKDIILMCELGEDATYVKHHKKKIALLFSAMRHFSKSLEKKGFRVEYVPLDHPDNTGRLTSEIERSIKKHQPEKIVATFPGEYRQLCILQKIKNTLHASIEILEDKQFYCSPKEFSLWSRGYKSPRMEYFYREMRKKFQILMTKEGPVGGKWNYDSENRKIPPKDLPMLSPSSFTPDAITQNVLDMVEKKFSDHFGDLHPFSFATTRDQALQVLDQFIKERLPSFGTYQDAMVQDQPWMFHSHLSFYLNCGLLTPFECIQSAEKSYYEGHAPLHCVEGFIRQILGWREYVRGIYWLKMPGYKDENFLKARRSLPEFFWTADTKMNCLKQCIKETKENAYAHHIQRLMVLGNFALLTGIHPDHVNEWYLIVYADAYEWVELPNVSGMILFADGGYLGTKPYAAGGGYIRKMSDYCKKCAYDVTKKQGPKACPFNYLYWDFLIRHRGVLSKNPRIQIMYRTYDRMSPDLKESYKNQSLNFLKNLS